MKLTCPACSAAIPSADINVDTGIAKCVACGEVINIFRALGLPDPAPLAPAAPKRPLAPRPKKMVIDDRDPSAWAVRWRWFGLQYLFLLLFCIAWDGFLIFWYSMAFHGGPWIMILFPIGHVAVGIGLTYSVLAGFLNQTWLQLDSSTLRIRHGPVYWTGNRQLPTDSITQLFCRQSKSWNNNRGQTQFELCAALQNGSELRLLKLPSLGEAQFLEQQIESRLGITPQPVAGEIS